MKKNISSFEKPFIKIQEAMLKNMFYREIPP